MLTAWQLSSSPADGVFRPSFSLCWSTARPNPGWYAALRKVDFHSRKGRRLVRTGAITLLGLLAIGVARIVVTPPGFPQRAAGSFFRSSLVEISQPFDFIALYIPSNPFASLANNVVPAVVLFGILLGAAMIGLERKEVLLGPLDILGEALNKLNKLVIRVTPAGVFAIAGGNAGTMTPAELVRLQAYLLAYSLVGVLLIFLVLPFVVPSLTPFRYRSLFSVFRDSFITIFATARIIVVRPQLVENVKILFKQAEFQTEESDRAAETLLPLAYPFPNLGTFTIMIFVPFASWYLGRSIETGDYLMFISSLVPSSFVAPVTGLPFLLEQLQIPADMFELFVISTVYTDRIRVVIGAIHLIVLTVIVIAAAGYPPGISIGLKNRSDQSWMLSCSARFPARPGLSFTPHMLWPSPCHA